MVIDLARGQCEYCRTQMRYAPDPFSVEHIQPRSLGGKSDPSNLALSCQGCNNLKFTSTESTDPITGLPARLFHPRQNRWNSHFAWSEDLTQIVGRTPTGRATIDRLQLNRAGVVNLREVLASIGKHPDDAEIM